MSVTFRGDKTVLPFVVKDGKVCDFCQLNVFNDGLRIALETGSERRPHLEYTQSCLGVYKACIAGCPWCTLVAKTVAFIAEYVNSMNADSDESDDEPNHNTSPIGLLDCGAALTIAISFMKPNNDLHFDAVTAKVETNGQVTGCLPRLTGCDAINIAFKVSANDSPVFQSHWGRISADHDEWLPPAQSWLQACRAHVDCQPTSSNEHSFMPSRFLDVADLSRPKLTTRAAIASGQDRTYCTLSYVWGTAKVYTLTTQTQSQLLEGIDPKVLSKTIRDAIYVASKLRIRYLWVDALCILQDSNSDKAVELPQMADIYRCSALTISAASAEASSEGFLRPPEGPFYPERPPLTLPLGTRNGKAIYFQLGTPILGGVSEKEPIFKRAWTHQEQLLSHRNLSFNRDGVIWECVEHRITYEGTMPRTDGECILNLRNAKTPAEERSIYEHWASLRLHYCQRELTVLGDKLDAISALAFGFYTLTGWTYLAGLWEERLLDDLLWCHVSSKDSWDRSPKDYPVLKSVKARATKAIAPSWSWASVLEGHIYSTDTEIQREAYHFEVLGHNIGSGDAGPYGSVENGTLTVSGKLVDLSFRPIFRSDDFDLADIALFAAEEPLSVVAYGVSDVLDAPLSPDAHLICLAVATTVIMGREVCEGLMLLPVSHGVYRRVGFFRAYDLSSFQAAAQQQIVLC